MTTKQDIIDFQKSRAPDYEFPLSVDEVAQAVANYLVQTGRLAADFKGISTNFVCGLGSPSVFQLWEERGDEPATFAPATPAVPSPEQ